jgi:hypothetical protein
MDPKLVRPMACLAVCSGALLGMHSGRASEGIDAQEPTASRSAVSGSPSPGDVQAAVGRVFRGAAALSGSVSPLTGDFNGDGIPDLVVVVRPEAGSIEAFRSPLSNWILDDPRARGTPFHPLPVDGATVFVAMIHGYGPAGWRNPEARETYVLAGIAPLSLRARPIRDGDLDGPRSRARLSGDAIDVASAEGQGVLCWDGARYAYRRVSGLASSRPSPK